MLLGNLSTILQRKIDLLASTQVGIDGTYQLSPSQVEALGLRQYNPQGFVDVYDRGGWVNICFFGLFGGGEQGPTYQYACVNPGFSTAEVARILGVSTQPALIPESTKVTAKPVETSGPVTDGTAKPPSQTWTDIAVPVPPEEWLPTGDLTSEGGAPSSIAVPVHASQSPQAKPFPWGLLAIAAALLMGS
jgi:hypothetical protein